MRKYVTCEKQRDLLTIMLTFTEIPWCARNNMPHISHLVNGRLYLETTINLNSEHPYWLVLYNNIRRSIQYKDAVLPSCERPFFKMEIPVLVRLHP